MQNKKLNGKIYFIKIYKFKSKNQYYYVNL